MFRECLASKASSGLAKRSAIHVRVIDFNQRTARETGLAPAQMTRRFAARRSDNRRACVNFLKHLPQLVAKVFHVLETISRFFRECAIDNLLQARRDRTRAQLGNRSRRIVQHCVTHVDRRLTAKRPGAGQHFVKQHAERKDVGAFIDAIAARLFRRSVSRRAVRNADFGEFGAMNA